MQAFPLTPEEVGRDQSRTERRALPSTGPKLAEPFRDSREVLPGLLSEIGYVVRVKESPDGKLMIIDGHLRAKPVSKHQHW